MYIITGGPNRSCIKYSRGVRGIRDMPHWPFYHFLSNMKLYVSCSRGGRREERARDRGDEKGGRDHRREEERGGRDREDMWQMIRSLLFSVFCQNLSVVLCLRLI
jgi:hypothetical protein